MDNKKGFTLLEVIITIAIVGIIAIHIFTISSSGLRNIMNAGIRTKNIINLQNQLNVQIKEYDNIGADIVMINIPEVVDNIEISGKNFSISSDGITLNTFVPNKFVID